MWIKTLSIFMSLYFLSSMCEETLLKQEGTQAVLTPDKTTGPLNIILWKQGDNFAMEYLGDNTIAYSPFKERGHLNTTNGAMTIRDLIRSDSGLYTVEINSHVNKKINLKVFAPVRKPTVSASCGIDHCNLTCVGDTLEAAPVSFLWIIGDGKPQLKDKEYRITKDVDAENIWCEIENPVSSQKSDAFHNPFFSSNASTPTWIWILLGGVAIIAIALILWFLHKKGIFTMPTCATGPEPTAKYAKAPKTDPDAPNGLKTVRVEQASPPADPTHRPGGNEKAAEKDHGAPNEPETVKVEQAGPSVDPTQRPNGNEVEVYANVHPNPGNGTGQSREDQPGSGHGSGDAPPSSDNLGNGDGSKSTDKPGNKPALDKKTQEDELEHING